MPDNKKIPIEVLKYLSVKSDLSISFPFYTFLYITYGTVDIRLGEEFHPYAKNDLLLLYPDRECLLHASDECELMVLGLSPAFLEDHLNMASAASFDSTLHPDQDYLPLKRQLCATADLYAKNDEGISYSLLGSCYMLLGELQRLANDAGIETTNQKYSDRVKAIADYIDRNYAKELTLSDLANEFYLTPQYLSTFFRDNFHTNFKNYLNNLRLFYSLRDLRNSSLPISEIAVRNGFSSFSTYRKNFERQYGMTPSEFRLRHKNNITLAAAETSLSSEESHAPSDTMQETIPINLNSKPERCERKEQIINIGAVQNLESHLFRQHLISFCRNCSYRYVRLMGLVASSFIPAMLPDYAPYFQNADLTLSFLFDNKLIPFIELSRQQFNFIFSPGEHLRNGYVQRTDRWFRLLEQFLQHVITRWPQSWLSQWKFELWMNPADTAPQYAVDFVRVCQLIKKYIPDSAVGGPGYLYCMTPAEPEEVLDAFQQMDAKPDFISAYLTCYEKISVDKNSSRSAISPDPDYPVRTAKSLRLLTKKYFPDTPFYITEWSSAFLPDVPVAQSRFQANYLMKTRKEIAPWCDLSGYWLFTDTQKLENPFQERSVAMIGQGLLSRDFKPTAAYYACRLMAELGPYQYPSGKNFIFRQKGPEQYQLLCFYYQHFLSQDAPRPSGAAGIERIYEMFEQSQALEIHLKISGLKPGLYRIQRYRINRFHGCLFDILIGEYQHSKISETEFLQKRQDINNGLISEEELSLPELRNIYLPSDGTLELQSRLEAHDIIFWEINRQV